MCGIGAVSPAANIVPVLLEGLRKLDYQKKGRKWGLTPIQNHQFGTKA